MILKKCAAGVFMMAALLYNSFITIALADATSARAAYVMEMQTGRVLFAYHENERLPMASTTKVMTALLALERGNLDDMVITTDQAYGAPGTSIYLSRGEQLTLEQMLYGLLISSGNDAAIAIAEHIGGSVDDFCTLMNQRAVELGAKNTHFVNPNGLPAKDHYTTAEDLTRIAAEAMKNPIFREIVSTCRASIPWEGREYLRVLKNKNALLTDYEGATGIKTGFTRAAGRCLVFGARRGEMELVGVVLNCPGWFQEAENLLDDCFAQYTWFEMLPPGEQVGDVAVLNSLVESVPVMLRGALAAPVTESELPLMKLEWVESIVAPQPAGAQVGWATMIVDDVVLDRKPLVLAEPVLEAPTAMRRWWSRWPLLSQ